MRSFRCWAERGRTWRISRGVRRGCGVLPVGRRSEVVFVISGYYGFDNLGDEAVLAAILHQLGNLAPGSRCIVISGNPASTAEEHGAEAVSRFDIKGLWTALRQGMVFISGGGTLFQDVTSTRSLHYYLLMVILARAFRLPVVIYGQGIGPFVSKLNSLLTRRVLKLCRLIIVREREAYRQLVEWGFDEEQLYLAADPAVALWNPSPDQAPSVGGRGSCSAAPSAVSSRRRDRCSWFPYVRGRLSVAVCPRLPKPWISSAGRAGRWCSYRSNSMRTA